jgi:hypothetical protein
VCEFEKSRIKPAQKTAIAKKHPGIGAGMFDVSLPVRQQR